MSNKSETVAKSAGTNRLKDEKSPYLLQHADNPVNWYPWGEEAFEAARAADKPIFLSIGYSTCHWCHVMEHESFEDAEVAALMNDAFVCVKVDREERPDIDNVYMTVCQMMTGSGGWPLTIMITPDKAPFFAATYIPKTSRFGRVGMLELIPRVKELWTARRSEVNDATRRIVGALEQISADTPGEDLEGPVLDKAYRQLAERFDVTYGGFGHEPKFPTPHNLLFLLRYWRRTGDEKALEMVEHTLQMIRRGGIYDHLGLGFHRYSTDERWLLPHFEKMLYDQALLVMAYTEAYQATGKATYAQTAREILSYVLRDMTSPEGGFYSAEDADSEGEEGKFYVWAEEEIRQVLGDDADLVIQVYGVEQAGNFTEEATGRKPGTNVLHMKQALEDVAGRLGMPPPELEDRLTRARHRLFTHREQRIHPLKDDKLLTDWNGLMIAAMSKAAQALGRPEYTAAARRAADFMLARMRRSDGRLLHRYRDGDAGIPANLSDYAFLTWGLIELYEACFEVRYLEAALDLNRLMLDNFRDEAGGGFYLTPDDGEDLPVRRKEAYDGAIPSGNSVAMLNLLRLGRMTGDSELERHAADLGRAFSGGVSEMPLGHTQMLVAADFAMGPSYEVVIAGDPAAADTREMLKNLRKAFLPNKVVLLRPDEPEPAIAGVAEFTKGQRSIDGKATAYVCLNFNCELPTTDASRMLELLSRGTAMP
jgi:uncharacterized protein YyaL (SSP411 family)